MAYVIYKDNNTYYVFAQTVGTASEINPNRIIQNQPSYLVSALKEQVRLAATSNISLTSTQTSIDGINLANGDRVLLTGQSAAKENGIYFWDAGHQKLLRAQDNFEVKAGLIVTVEEGVVEANTIWILATDNPITVDVTDLEFIKILGNTTHASTHLYGSTDEIFGDRLGIAYVPTNYTRDTTGPLTCWSP